MALDRLWHLFIPHRHNNHKPKTLHNSSLLALIGLAIMAQSAIGIFSAVKPGVLGYASQISPSKIIELTNKYRQEASLPPLTTNEVLNQAAKSKALDMFEKNYWAHNSPKGIEPWYFITQAGYKYLHAGENLARDFSDPNSIVTAWMNSPTHKANLLSSKYQDIGIAVVDGRLNGVETTLVVQMFGSTKSNPPQTKSAQTSIVDQAFAQEKSQSMSSPISPIAISRSISISFMLLVIATLAIDWLIIWKKKIVRISGKNWAHLTFMGTILLFIFLIKQGLVL